MTFDEKNIIEHILYLGEIPIALMRKLIPNEDRRYRMLYRWKADGIYRLTRDEITGYRINWNIRERQRRKVDRAIAEEGMQCVEGSPRADKHGRKILRGKAEVIVELYDTDVRYLPRMKPMLGDRFPFTKNVDTLHIEEIRACAREHGVYYSGAEYKRRYEKGDVIVDDTLRRNRASGILFVGDHGYIVYSFPLMKSTYMKWSKDREFPLYLFMSRILGSAENIDVIFIGSTLAMASELLEKTESERKKGTENFTLNLENCARGDMYYIPTKNEGHGRTRMIEYIINGDFRERMDDTIRELEEVEGERRGYSIGINKEDQYVYNLMDLNLNRLEHAMRMSKAKIYCFIWQEEFIREEFAKRGKEPEIESYDEGEILSMTRRGRESESEEGDGSES